MKSIKIIGAPRENVGKTNAKALRNSGQVPCVLYGGKEHLHFSAYSADFKELVYTPNTFTIDLDLNGTNHRAILQDMQFHPVSDNIIHADFMAIHDDRPVHIDIPVRIKGNSPGVRAGGKLIHKMKKLRVRAFAADLPDFVEVNIDEIEIGKSVKVGEIKIPKIEFLDAPHSQIVAVEVTRAVVVEKGAEAAPTGVVGGAPTAAAAAVPAKAPAKAPAKG